MSSMYYTPELESFHVGFEYEITNGYEWIKETFTHEHFNTFLYNHLDNAITQEQVRVKYLDKNDIKSLGGVPSKASKEYFVFQGKYRLCVDTVTPNLISITNIEKQDRMMFIGYIKNKSELKVLLKQIGIL